MIQSDWYIINPLTAWGAMFQRRSEDFCLMGFSFVSVVITKAHWFGSGCGTGGSLSRTMHYFDRLLTELIICSEKKKKESKICTCYWNIHTFMFAFMNV